MNNVHCISVTSLLNEKTRRNLMNEGLYRNLADDNDILWQHMELNRFAELIINRRLYFKAYREYSHYYEMRLRDYYHKIYEDNDKIKDTLYKTYDEIEKKYFVSCWFNSKMLSDMAFDTYAKNFRGIAIGTTAKDIINVLNDATIDEEKIANIYCGNVQYVSQNALKNEELFDTAQVVAPVFLKGKQFMMDKEYRVCVEIEDPAEINWYRGTNLEKHDRQLKNAAKVLDSLIKKKYDDLDDKEIINQFTKLITVFMKESEFVESGEPTSRYVNIDLLSLVKYIAVKKDELFGIMSDDEIIKMFEYCFKIKIREIKSGVYESDTSGFKVFQVDSLC